MPLGPIERELDPGAGALDEHSGLGIGHPLVRLVVFLSPSRKLGAGLERGVDQRLGDQSLMNRQLLTKPQQLDQRHGRKRCALTYLEDERDLFLARDDHVETVGEPLDPGGGSIRAQGDRGTGQLGECLANPRQRLYGRRAGGAR